MPNAQNSWYAIAKQKDSPDEAEVLIYDEIGAWGVDAKTFVNDLRGITAKRINVRLNTPGGSVFDGTAIHNALKGHPAEVVMHVEGVAASAGSFIMLAGDEVRMADNAYVMIHNSSGGVMGGADDMRGYAEILEKIDGNIALMYAGKTGKPPEHYRALMDAETWFTADEAKAEGLIDTVYSAAPPAAKASARTTAYGAIYNKIPDPVRRMWGLAIATPAPANTEPGACTVETQIGDRSIVFTAPTPQQVVELRDAYSKHPEQQVNEPAPEGSPRGEPQEPATTQEKPLMADTSVQAPPAPTPAAATVPVSQGSPPQSEVVKLNQQAIQGYIDQGRSFGRAEGIKIEQDRMRALIAAAPGRSDLAIQAFLAGQDSATVAMIANAEATAEAKANQKAAEQTVEIARLQALIATGGHSGVGMGVSAAETAVPVGLEPEQQAQMEWDSDAILRARHNNNKKAYTLYRVNQLKGNVRVLKTA
jgi:ATP-dependent Clp endopeptidase proteolytic subunit ClpP